MVIQNSSKGFTEIESLFGLVQTLGNAPTTEHGMLGNWSTSLFIKLGTAPTTEHGMLGDWSVTP